MHKKKERSRFAKYTKLPKKVRVTFPIPDEALKKTYAAASEDPDREQVIDDWSILDCKT